MLSQNSDRGTTRVAGERDVSETFISLGVLTYRLRCPSQDERARSSPGSSRGRGYQSSMSFNHEPPGSGSERTFRAPPPVRTFEETSGRHRPHQGLTRLQEASRLLAKGDPSNMNDVKGLVLQSLEGFQKTARKSGEGRPDEATVEGVRIAARLYIAAQKELSEAILLLRLFCSLHADSLREIALLVNGESADLAKEKASVATAVRSLRLLRLLISGFNCFLRHAQGSLYSNEAHVKQLEQAVGFAREAINNLSREFSRGDVGKASARLRGLTAIASFTRLSRDSSTQKRADESSGRFEVMRKMGYRDVDKLLKCLAGRLKQGEMTGYLQVPGNCVEAVGVLRRLAMSAHEVFPLIANAFADAVGCMDEASIGTWGGRPALQDATVRHCVVACAAHLADRLGRNPDSVRQSAVHNLWKALNDCCIMQSGQYVLDQPAASKGVAERASAENAAASRAAASRSTAGATPGSAGSCAGWPSRARPDSEARRSVTPPVGEGGGGRSSDENPVSVAERSRARSSHPSASDVPRTDVQSRQASLENPVAMDPAVNEESSRPLTPAPAAAAAPPPPPVERKAYPPLLTAPDSEPAWDERRTYSVALGETFERGIGKGERDAPPGHLVHLKYDFVPARTNIDVPATLRQGPLRSADGAIDESDERWKVDMQYDSRDSEKSRPVCFSGDASSAQDLECVMVFDGEKFVMDRVSVSGGLKYVQDSSAPSRSTGMAMAEAGQSVLGKRKEKGKGKGKRSATATATTTASKEDASKAETSGSGAGVSRRKGEGREESAEKGTKGDKASSMVARGVVVAPANRLSQPINKTRMQDGDTKSGDPRCAGRPTSAEDNAGGGGSRRETSPRNSLE